MKRIGSGVLAALLVTGCIGGSGRDVRAEAGGISIEEGPRLGSPRATHALVRVPDGRLLAIGGCVSDGCDAGPASATVDIIAPDGSRMTGGGRLLERRVQPAASPLADGTVLVIGGWVDGRVTASTEIFDPVTATSRPGPAMRDARSSPTLVRLADGRLLIAGGYDGRRALESAEIYNPATGRMARTGSLRIGRSGASGTSLANGRILIAGGGDGESAGRRALASAELYDPITGRFTQTGSLAQRRYKHAAVALPNGDVLLIGGADERDYGGKLDSVERYDAGRGRFVAAGTLALPRFKLADGVLLIDENRILIAAGDRHPEVFDVAKGRGTKLDADLGATWNYMTIAPAVGGATLLAGGYREGAIEPTDRSWIVRLPQG